MTNGVGSSTLRVGFAAVLASLHRVGPRRAWKSMDPLHQLAEVPFDVAAEMWPATGTVLEPNPVSFTASLERYAVEFGPLVEVQRPRHSERRPVEPQNPVMKPIGFGQPRHGERQPNGGHRRRLEGQMKATAIHGRPMGRREASTNITSTSV